MYRLLGDDLGWGARGRRLDHGEGVGVPGSGWLLGLFLLGFEGVEVEHVDFDVELVECMDVLRAMAGGTGTGTGEEKRAELMRHGLETTRDGTVRFYSTYRQKESLAQ